MITADSDFSTPRPHWATTTDVASVNFCSHVRDFSVGDVTLEIRQEDEPAHANRLRAPPWVPYQRGVPPRPKTILKARHHGESKSGRVIQVPYSR